MSGETAKKPRRREEQHKQPTEKPPEKEGPSLTPFHKEYWSRPKHKLSDTTTQDVSLIYTAVGQSLNAWESCEEMLAYLFLVVCDLTYASGSVAIAVQRAFGAIESNPTKADALTSAAEVYFGKYWEQFNIKGEFANIINCVRQAGYRRNDIAHGRVRQLMKPLTSPNILLQSRGMFLTAPVYKTREQRLMNPDEVDITALTSKYAYTHDDIISIASKFEALYIFIFRYADSIRKVGDDTLPLLVRQKIHDEKAQRSEKAQRGLAYKSAQQDALGSPETAPTPSTSQSQTE